MCDSSNNWSGPYIPANPDNGFDYKSTRNVLILMAERLAKYSGEIPEEFSSDEISVKYHNGHVEIVANFKMTEHVQPKQKRDIRLHDHVMDAFIQYSDAFSEEERIAVDEFFFNLSADVSNVIYNYYSNRVAINTKLDHPHQFVDEICVDAMNSPMLTIGSILIIFPPSVRKVLSKFHCLIWTKGSCHPDDLWMDLLFVYTDKSKMGVINNTFITRPKRLILPVLEKLMLKPDGSAEDTLKVCIKLNQFFEECLVSILSKYCESSEYCSDGLRFNTTQVDGIDGEHLCDDIVDYIVEHYGQEIKDYIVVSD